MIQLLVLLGVSMCLAYCSQNGILVYPLTKKYNLDIPLVIMVVVLALFCGLRVQYNDTTQYIASFNSAGTLKSYLDSSPGLFENPLFNAYMCFFRHNISDNVNAFFTTISLFSLSCILRFIKKHSVSFCTSILIFFALGLFVSHLAAMKQCIAIAILTFAIDALINKKYIKYYAIVFLAVLFHAYAIFFVVLPLFTFKPWSISTYVTIGIVAFVLLSFESFITGFLSVADDVGKNISESQVLDTDGINPLRLAVFAVPPLITFIFQELLNDEYTRARNIFTNMSLLSFLVMSLGIFSAANLFGRSAIYFELGTIIILPQLVKNIFDERSQNFGNIIVSLCYLLFFVYSIQGFSSEYRAISIGEFIEALL